MACNCANISGSGISTFEIRFSPTDTAHRIQQSLNVTTSTNTFKRQLESQSVYAPEDIFLTRTTGGYLVRFLKCGECFGPGTYLPFGCYRIVTSGCLGQLDFSVINLHVKTEYNTFLFPVHVTSNQMTYLNLRESAFPVFDSYPISNTSSKTQHIATVTHHSNGQKTITLTPEA